MAVEKHPCENGLTEECFEKYPAWAKQALAYKLMHLLCPAAITRRLPKWLHLALIGEGVILPPGYEPPPGTVIPPGYTFPPGWSPGDPLPPAFGPGPPPGIIVPPGGVIPPTYLNPNDPGPRYRPRAAPPVQEVTIEITAQNDGRQAYCAWGFWNEAHEATSGNLIFPGETETTEGIKAANDMPDFFIFRSFFDFDLSAIPAGASIMAATLTLQSCGAGVCEASLQEGTQSDALGPEDYGAFTGSLFDTLTWIIGSNVFTLNVAGRTYVESKFGDTAKLCMREYDHDYLDIEPAIGEDFYAGLYWSGAPAANRPKLTVTYSS